MKLILTLLLLCCPVLAQPANFRAVVGISAGSGNGVRNPVLSVGIGGDAAISETVTLDINASVQRRRKTPGNGYAFDGDASVRVGQRLFAVGGVAVQRQLTDLYTKTRTNIFGGLGYRDDNTVLSGVYLAPDLTSPNKVQGGKFKLEFFLPHRIYVAPTASILNFRCNKGLTSTLPDRCTSAEAGVGIGIYFTR